MEGLSSTPATEDVAAHTLPRAALARQPVWRRMVCQRQPRPPLDALGTLCWREQAQPPAMDRSLAWLVEAPCQRSKRSRRRVSAPATSPATTPPAASLATSAPSSGSTDRREGASCGSSPPPGSCSTSRRKRSNSTIPAAGGGVAGGCDCIKTPTATWLPYIISSPDTQTGHPAAPGLATAAGVAPDASFSRLSPSSSAMRLSGPPAWRSTAVMARASVEASTALRSRHRT